MSGERTLVVNIIGDSASAQRAFAKTGAAADAAAAQMGRAGKGIESTGSKIEATGRKIETAGSKINKVGTGFTKYVSLPLIGVGAAAVHMSLDFQKSMLLVETHTETSRKQVEQYKQAILDMSGSGKFTQGPKEFADAMYHIASDGYHGKKAIDALRESANLAMLGQSDLAETTYAVVSAMKTGIKGTENLHQAIGTLNGTMGAGDTKMGELVAALSTGVVPSARAAGLELTDVGAALAFLTARGIPAQKAAYGLSMNFQQLVPYTKKANEEFEALGLNSEALGKKAEAGPMGWLHALETLKSRFKALGLDVHEETRAIEEIFGGGRSSRGVLAQMQNLEDLRATYERLGVIAGRTDKNLKIARESEANQWKEEWAQAQAVLVELGNQLTPILIPLMQEVAHDVEDVVEAFESLPKGTQEWILKIGLAAAALGPVVKIIGTLTKGVGGLVLLIGKAAKAFEGMAAAEEAAAVAGGSTSAGGAAGGVAAGEAAGAGAVAGDGAARWLGTEASQGSYLAAEGLTGTVPMTEAEAVAASGLFGGAGAGALTSTAGSALAGAGGIAGGYFAAEFGVHAIEGITGKDFLENQSLLTSLTHGLSTSPQKGKATEEQGLKMAHAQEEGVHPRLGLHTKERKELEASFKATMVNLASSGAAGINTVNTELQLGLEKTDKIWSTGTEPWRAHTAEAMQGAVAAIKDGIRDGTINADAGHKEINKLLREIHVVKSDDPLGLAEATVKSFKKAGGITATGVKQWERELEGMKPAARKSTIDATNEMLSAWAQGHPKIEHEIESLTSFEITHFGATNRQLREGVRKGATGPVAEAFREAAEGVGGALQNIGTNTDSILKALDLNDMLEFQALVLGPSRLEHGAGRQASSERHHYYAPGSYHGKGSQHKAGGGAIARVPGRGLEDNVPLFVNGAMSAIVAPGEDLVAVNRHQGPLLDLAVANTFGVSSLDDFFHTYDRPHNFARGGEVKVKGPGKIGEIGHGAIAKAVKAANEYIARHEPKPKPGAGAGLYHGKLPAGVGTFEGVPVDLWIIPILKWAKAHGWGGSVTSGYRTPEQQMAAAEAYGLGHYGSAGPLGSNHVKTAYPGGAVDVSDPAGLAAVLARYPRKPNLVWGGPVMGDEVHFSATGHARGGRIPLLGSGGQVINGKVSWFNGGATAGGSSTSRPGIAVNLSPGSDSGWNNPTTQGWMEDSRAGHPTYAAVTIAGHSANLPIIDLGPSGFTDRAIDVTEGGVRKLGFTTSNFPTDAVGRAVILGSGGSSKSAEKQHEKAKERREKRREEEKEQTVGGAIALEATPLKSTPLPKSAKGLSKAVKDQLRAPGITYTGKVGVSERALSQTQESVSIAERRAERLRTQGQALEDEGRHEEAQAKYSEAEHLEAAPKRHEEAVLDYQQELFEKRRKKLKADLAQVEKQLKVVRNPGKQKQLLGKAQHLREELGQVQSDLSSVRTERTNLREPVEGLQPFEGEAEEDPAVKAAEAAQKAAEEQKQAAEEMKEAMIALKESVDLQNKIAGSEMAINVAEAKKAFTDIVAGQLGPRLANKSLAVSIGQVGSS